MDTKLKEILHISEPVEEDNSPLGIWYKNVLNKDVREVTLGDYGKMLRQKVLLEFALPCVLGILTTNPFEGEMYDGELLELLIRVLKENNELIKPKELQECSGLLKELAGLVNDHSAE